MTRRPALRLMLVAALLIVVAAAGLWLARRPLATELVDRALATRGIPARYAIEAIGPQRAVLRRVSLGPPDRPDLVARAVTVDYGWSFTPTAIRLDGAVLRATVGAAGLSFGSLDALIPPGRSRTLPAIAVTIPAGIVLLDTPAGPLRLRGSAEGWLPDGFRARLDAAPARLALAGCTAAGFEAGFDVLTKQHRIDIAGEGGAATLACAAPAGLAANDLAWDARVVVPADLATAGGVARLATGGVVLGDGSAAEAELGISFAGPPERPAGSWRLNLVRGRAAGAGVGRLDARGHFAARTADATLSAGGDFTAVQVAAPLDAAWARWPGPFGPLAARAAAASREADIRAPFELQASRAGWSLHLPRLGADAASGARLRLDGGDGLRLGDTGASLDGLVAVEGGGLPAARLTLAALRPGPGGSGGGTLQVSGWRSGAAALGPLALGFRLAGDRLVTTGRARLSGRFGATRVDGLELPLDAAVDLRSGAVATAPGCATVAAAGIATARVRIEPLRLRACPAGAPPTLRDGRVTGVWRLDPIALRGTLDDAPIGLATAAPATLALGGTLDAPRLRFAAPAVRVVTAAATVAGGIEGALAPTAAGLAGAGRLDDARLVAATVDGAPAPLTVESVAGAWRLDPGGIALSGLTARVADRADRPRLAPLRLEAADVSLRGAALAAAGTVRLAAGGPPLARFTARHDLGSGIGDVAFAGAPRFGPDLQPYQVSELARGVVENVAGVVGVDGRLGWRGDRLAGTATIRLEELSLATAALGPVERLSGVVTLDDLPGLTTPPGQRLTIGALNPGVRVEDGVALFRLTGGGAVEIASIVWPFAKGTLTLRPVTLAPGDPARGLTLDVAGLDAESFLARFEIPDLRVTGSFDGALPLVFDAAGGRIAGGRLVARPPGGVVQYVGSAGSQTTGGARLAFDALRSLRYDRLVLGFDGDLDGELVTALSFTGVNEAPVGVAGRLPLRAVGLPFKFGVSVRAPFRALLGTAASFGDVRGRLREGLVDED